MIEKICGKCGGVFPIENYYRNNRLEKLGYNDGVSYWCKSCDKNNYNNWRSRNKEKRREYAKKWKAEHLEYRKDWYYAHRDERIASNAKWYSKNKKKRKEYDHKLKNTIAFFNKFNLQLIKYEEVRKNPENEEELQVRCYNSNCRSWFSPTYQQVYDRLSAINNLDRGSRNFYCSSICKNTCEVYHRSVKRKSEIKKRIFQDARIKSWTKLVLIRDNFTCQLCGVFDKLKAHHIESVTSNPVMAADLDNGITLCEECHNKVHEEKGCTYQDLRCKKWI